MTTWTVAPKSETVNCTAFANISVLNTVRDIRSACRLLARENVLRSCRDSTQDNNEGVTRDRVHASGTYRSLLALIVGSIILNPQRLLLPLFVGKYI